MKNKKPLTSISRLTVTQYIIATLVAVSSLISTSALAESIAITNAEVYTVTSQGRLSKATVIFNDGKITAVYSQENRPKTLTVDKVIDAKGRILTPGFIASNNLLGLIEVGAVAKSRDAADEKADITFDASLAFNPKSSLIPYTRKGGITSNIVIPHGGDSLFKGQSFAVNLSGNFDSIISRNNSVIVKLGSTSKGSRALTLQKLTNTLADAQKQLTKAQNAKTKNKDKNKDKDKEEPKEPKRAEIIINALLAGEKPLLAFVDRATDILALLALKEKYQLDLVLVGAKDAILVKEAIVKADVPIMVNAIDNLPSSFDTLHGDLTNLKQLHQAGIKIIIATSGESHNINQLRFDAGVAVANGLAHTAAIAAMTANVADVFKLNAGRIMVDKTADLVLWSSDPFEISSKVDMMWIKGKQVSTQSRQDALRKRYTSQSKMPRAYSK